MQQQLDFPGGSSPFWRDPGYLVIRMPVGAFGYLTTAVFHAPGNSESNLGPLAEEFFRDLEKRLVGKLHLTDVSSLDEVPAAVASSLASRSRDRVAILCATPDVCAAVCAELLARLRSNASYRKNGHG